MKGTWDLVNNVLKGKRNHRDECQNLLEEGHEISDGQLIADEFGKLFLEIGSDIK